MRYAHDSILVALGAVAVSVATAQVPADAAHASRGERKAPTKQSVAPRGANQVVVYRKLPALSPLLRLLQEARSANEFHAALKQLSEALAISPFDPMKRPKVDRVLGGPNGSRSDEPLQRWGDTRITDALRGKQPKGMIVGSPSAKIDSSTMVRQDGAVAQLPAGPATTTAEHQDSQGGTTVTSITTDASGMVIGTKVAHYNAQGNLKDWHTVAPTGDGGFVHHEGEVDEPGNPHSTVSLDSYTTDGHGTVHVDYADVQRPHNSRQGDPPITLFERRQRAGWMPLEESRGRDNAAWCNPISRHCQAEGRATSGNRVNPGRELKDPGGSRLKAKGLAVNPSPDSLAQDRQPRPLDRSSIDPSPGPMPQPDPN